MSLIEFIKEDSGDIFEPKLENPVINCEVVKKFTSYRSKSESIYAENEETKEVINRLRGEVIASREIEKSHRLQILSLQNRVVMLEENRRRFSALSKKQRKSEEDIQEIDRKLMDLTNRTQELREMFQTAVNSATRDLDLAKRSRDLKIALQHKEVALNKIRTEMDSVSKDKEKLILWYESQNEQLREELKKSKLETGQVRDAYQKTINLYRKQLVDYKKTIEQMEKDKWSILEDYEVGNIPEATSDAKSTGNNGNNQVEKGVTWPDSTVTSFSEERESSAPTTHNADYVTGPNARLPGQFPETGGVIRPEVTESQKQKGGRNKPAASKFPKLAPKQKPQLSFVDHAASCKRRLYSQDRDQILN